jgi:hypothetical protein
VETEVRLAEVAHDPQRRPDASRRVVLVGRRRPEDPDHRVADELLHDTAVGLDHLPGAPVIRRHEPIDVLRVEALRQLR